MGPECEVAKAHYHWLLRPTLLPLNVPFMHEVSWIVGFSDVTFLSNYVLGLRTLGWGDPALRFITGVMEPLYD